MNAVRRLSAVLLLTATRRRVRTRVFGHEPSDTCRRCDTSGVSGRWHGEALLRQRLRSCRLPRSRTLARWRCGGSHQQASC